MPANVGGQTVSLKFKAPGNSDEINRRFLNTRPVGIYTGGILTVSDGSHANISSLVCEIGDGTYQVRIATSLTVNLAVASGTPYIILRWSYTGDTQDYMELLAVASASVLDTDLVVGKCVFTAGSLSGFDYGGSVTLHRSVPAVHDLYLKVVPTAGSTLKALVMPGWIQGQQNSYFVPMQETSALVPPVSNPKIYLVCLDDTGTISVDSTGAEAVSPVEPNHKGKLVLAQILLSPGDAAITEDMITNVQAFVTKYPPDPDGTTIEQSSTGVLKVVDPQYLVRQSNVTQAIGQSSWTKLTYDNLVKTSGISESSGVVTLTAGKLYVMSYTIQITPTTASSPFCQARLRVLSGDISWEFKNDDNNVSLQQYYVVSGVTQSSFITTLSGTYIILPASTTTIQLEVLTKDPAATIKQSQVIDCSLSILSR